MSDLISRADAIEAVKDTILKRFNLADWYEEMLNCGVEIEDRIKALPSADAVSREDYHNLLMASNDIDRALREYQAKEEIDAVDCTEFIEWLVDRVLDETIWEYNSVAYGEIICRKLEKLGVLETTEEPSYYIRPSAEAVQETVPTVVRVTMSDGSQYYLEHERDAIQADAVQGEWIWRTDIPIGDGRTSAGYICSNCGKDYWHGNVFKYCPSCGARMKGGAE